MKLDLTRSSKWLETYLLRCLGAAKRLNEEIGVLNLSGRNSSYWQWPDMTRSSKNLGLFQHYDFLMHYWLNLQNWQQGCATSPRFFVQSLIFRSVSFLSLCYIKLALALLQAQLLPKARESESYWDVGSHHRVEFRFSFSAQEPPVWTFFN